MRNCLIWLLCLFLLNIGTAFAESNQGVVQSSPAIVSQAGVIYGGQLQAKIAYDGPSEPTNGYDAVAMLTTSEGKDRTLENYALFAKFAEFLAADSGAFSAIGSTGKVGEQYLQTLGGESQVYFPTSQGGRYIDQLVNGVANESKVGYQSLTPSIQLQISKDAELLNINVVQGVNWHFFQSPVTGLGGPSQPLLNALQQNGFNVIIH